jgi:hypothetical protein
MFKFIKIMEYTKSFYVFFLKASGLQPLHLNLVILPKEVYIFLDPSTPSSFL